MLSTHSVRFGFAGTCVCSPLARISSAARQQCPDWGFHQLAVIGYAGEYGCGRSAKEHRLQGRGDVDRAYGTRPRDLGCLARSALCGNIRRRCGVSPALPIIRQRGGVFAPMGPARPKGMERDLHPPVAGCGRLRDAGGADPGELSTHSRRAFGGNYRKGTTRKAVRCQTLPPPRAVMVDNKLDCRNAREGASSAWLIVLALPRQPPDDEGPWRQL